MLSFCKHLNFRKKLILFSFLPFLLIATVSAIHIKDQYQQYQIATRDKAQIALTKQISHLIFQLQTERELSTDYVTSHNSAVKIKLLASQKKTNHQISIFAHSPYLANLLQNPISPFSTEVNLAFYIKKLKIKSKKINNIRKEILNFNNQHYTKFYNQYIDCLLSIIHKLQIQSHDIAQNQAYNDLLHILTIQETASKQMAMIDIALLKHHTNLSQYEKIQNAISAHDFAIDEAFESIINHHKKLLVSLVNSEESHQVFNARKKIESQLSIAAQAKRIRYHLGYTGLLQDYRIQQQLNANTYEHDFIYHKKRIYQLLQQINEDKGKTANQIKAINSLKLHLSTASENAIHNIALSSKKNLQIKRDIHISDALDILQNPELTTTSTHWFNDNKNYIKKINKLNQHIIEHITQLNLTQQHHALKEIIYYFSAAIVTIILSILLGYIIISGLIRNIKVIACDLQKMTKDPLLKLTIKVHGHDEVSQIADGLNQMLEERQKAHYSLNLAMQVFEHSAEGILITNNNNVIEMVNPAFTAITGFEQQDLVGKTPSIFRSTRHSAQFYSDFWKQITVKGEWQGEIWNITKNKQLIPLHLSINIIKDENNNINKYIGLYTDISKDKQYEKDIWHQAHFDKLTNLPNRQLFKSKLSQCLNISNATKSLLGLVLIDIDNFKYINDVEGHATGDKLLQCVASRLSSLLIKNQFIARFGGDEFIFLIPELKKTDELTQLANQIQACFATPFNLNGKNISVSTSIGMAISPDHGTIASTLNKNIETAMFQAKALGRNKVITFDISMNALLETRLKIEQRLRLAVVNGDFFLNYQPLVVLASNQVTSAEVLLRWQDAELGLIPPDQFIPIAEETGLIEIIGRWVVKQALNDLKILHQKGHYLAFAINVSSRQLNTSSHIKFSEFLKQAITDIDIHPRYINIEITESVFMNETEENLNELLAIKRLGCHIYLDDFGTGFSSLSYLRKFPISVLKIDKSFIDNVINNSSDANLVKAIINIGKSLELDLVAEGIECEEQLHFLNQQGCHYGQGYLMSKPLQLNALGSFLTSRKK